MARRLLAMKRVGIFYHKSFSQRSYLTVGRRLAEFPGALVPLLRNPAFRLLDSPEAPDEWVLRVHDPRLIPAVEADPL